MRTTGGRPVDQRVHLAGLHASLIGRSVQAAARARAIVRPEELPNRVRTEPRRSAEVKMYDALRMQLGSGWSIFYSVGWLAHGLNGARDGEADFVLAHPAKGVLLVEVKGGRIRYDASARQWISQDRQGVDHPIDPFGQVRGSKHALLGKLKEIPSLRNRWIRLAHAVAFPDVERPRQPITPDAPPEIIIGADDLANLPARIDEILLFSAPAGEPWVDEGQLVVQELTSVIGRSTELRNPLSLATAEEDREIVRLTEEQFRLLDHLSRVRRAAIGGCAGAGKTFLAAEKAKRLAREGFRTLLTCYNRPLADHLAAVTQGTVGLDVMNFHQVCHRFIIEARFPVPPSLDDYSAVLCDATEALPEKRYDAIVVDEGQDFEDTWWIALESCLQAGTQSVFYVFHDTHQALYRGRGSLPGDLTEIPLTENIRNTRSIFQVLARHYKGDDAIQARGPVGRTVEPHLYDTTADLSRLLARILSRLLTQEGLTNRDLVVLTPNSLEKSSLLKLTLPPPLELVTEEPAPGSKKILCSTIHRFKGLERHVAIVAELDDAPTQWDGSRDPLYYVGFSRPRTHLILLGKKGVVERLLPGVV